VGDREGLPSKEYDALKDKNGELWAIGYFKEHAEGKETITVLSPARLAEHQQLCGSAGSNGNGRGRGEPVAAPVAPDKIIQHTGEELPCTY
jgi:hypothetical protein